MVGLTSTVRLQAGIRPRPAAARAPAAKPDCERPYPSRKRMIQIAQTGAFPPTGYGAAPNCNGLSPAQTNSIYHAPRVGARGKGQGVTLGVFELSAYQPSDIRVYTSEFFGPAYNPPLTDINVDGGPLHPICPLGDTAGARGRGGSSTTSRGSASPSAATGSSAPGPVMTWSPGSGPPSWPR